MLFIRTIVGTRYSLRLFLFFMLSSWLCVTPRDGLGAGTRTSFYKSHCLGLLQNAHHEGLTENRELANTLAKIEQGIEEELELAHGQERQPRGLALDPEGHRQEPDEALKAAHQLKSLLATKRNAAQVVFGKELSDPDEVAYWLQSLQEPRPEPGAQLEQTDESPGKLYCLGKICSGVLYMSIGTLSAFTEILGWNIGDIALRAFSTPLLVGRGTYNLQNGVLGLIEGIKNSIYLRRREDPSSIHTETLRRHAELKKSFSTQPEFSYGLLDTVISHRKLRKVLPEDSTLLDPLTPARTHRLRIHQFFYHTPELSPDPNSSNDSGFEKLTAWQDRAVALQPKIVVVVQVTNP